MLKVFLRKFFPCFCRKSSTKVVAIKKRKRKENDSFQISQIWKSFFNYSTIDGLYLIYGSRVSAKVARIASLVFLIIASICCLYQCCDFLQMYLRVPLKTSMVYQPVNELTFPAITFCHTFVYKRTAIAPIVADTDKQVMNAFISFVIRNEAEEKLFQQLVSKKI